MRITMMMMKTMNTKINSNRKYKDIIEGRFDIAKVVYIV